MFLANVDIPRKKVTGMLKLAKRFLKNKFIRFVVIYPFLFILLLVGCLVLYLVFRPRSVEEQVRGVSQRVFDLEQSGNYAQIYDEYLDPSYKLGISKDDFIAQQQAHKKATSDSIEINEVVSTAPDRALVDRTRTTCYGEACTKERAYKTYVKVNGRWLLFPNIDVYCPNTKPYSLNPEFERALSLIGQRMGDQNTKYTDEFTTAFKKIRNCLNVRYATASDTLGDANGYFSFKEGQSPKELDIVVSPKYEAKDDLLTAVLLIHEVSHAYDYVWGLHSGTPVGCYETEARAFFAENALFVSLNKEERYSIVTRATQGYSSDAADVVRTFLTTAGANSMDNIMEMVKNSTAYQKQCSQQTP